MVKGNVFQIIAAALGLALSDQGTRDNPDYDAHLKAIDDKLQNDEAHEASDNSAQSVRLDVIEQGLQAIADSLPSGSASGGTPGPAAGDSTGATVQPPVDTTGLGGTSASPFAASPPADTTGLDAGSDATGTPSASAPAVAPSPDASDAGAAPADTTGLGAATVPGGAPDTGSGPST